MLRLFNLNIYRGKCIDEIISFINEQKFDIVHLQEVVGKSFSYPGVDCFAEIEKHTGLRGELFTMWHHKGHESGHCGNATFFKSSLKLKESLEYRTKPFLEMEDPDLYPTEDHPKGALFLRFETGGKEFWCINAYLAWGPTPFDEPYKVRDAELLAKQIVSLQHPFVLSGDFNVVPETKVVKLLEPYGRNLTCEYGFSNTLNPHMHKAKHLFPKGLAVDFVFVHPNIQVHEYKKLDAVELSDHIGLTLDFSILSEAIAK
ncbi:MAG: hypothetical protein KGZ39_07510 [Simkania sp.]|nr:hypothetical protein [Simkania sp.]